MARLKKSEDAGDLIDGREALRSSGEAVLPERRVTFPFPYLGEVGQRRVGGDQRQKPVRRDDLMDGEPAVKSTPTARGTADGSEELRIRHSVHFAQPRVVRMRLFALRTKAAHQSLGGDEPQ